MHHKKLQILLVKPFHTTDNQQTTMPTQTAQQHLHSTAAIIPAAEEHTI